MSALFYAPLLDPASSVFVLDEAESKHVVRVLRLGVGEPVRLVDGRGGLYDAVIQEAHPKKVLLQVKGVQHQEGRRRHELHIAIAPTKNMDRLEWFIEKATEIGIDEITPLICDRSERKDVKVERLEKVAVAAMKQSLKAYLPRIHAPAKFTAFVDAQHDPVRQRFIAHCEPGEKQFLSTLVHAGGPVTILIGPEGDFSPGEIAEALATGFQPISLGESRLRTETAAVAACLEVALLNR